MHVPRASVNPWTIACLAREIPRNAPLGVVLEGRPLVLFRDSQGSAAALEDRCAHRNAPLSLGAMREGTLECAYHGWRYDRCGRVAEVPALPEPAARQCLHVVRSYPTTEQQGFIWVSLDDPAPSPAPLEFPNFGAPGWTHFTMKTAFRAPVDACLENFLDLPHATFVHRYWFRAPTARQVKAKVRTLADGAEAEFFEEPRERSLVWWLLSPRRGAMRHTDRFIAPRTSRVEYAFEGGLHYVITSSCSSVGPGLTQVYTVISFRYPRLGWLVRLFFEPLARRIIRQDVDILGAQYANVERFGGPAYAVTPADLLAPHISRWRHALATGAAAPGGGEEHDVVIRI
jgi:phenylpropionate dioxygenase-like ring-hydroxylating dioxygenase large terminal subunit